MFSSITFAPALVAVFTLREGHWPRPRPCSAAPPTKHYPGDTRPAPPAACLWNDPGAEIDYFQLKYSNTETFFCVGSFCQRHIEICRDSVSDRTQGDGPAFNELSIFL